MKKIILLTVAVLLCLSVALCLLACGGDSSNQTNNASDATNQSSADKTKDIPTLVAQAEAYEKNAKFTEAVETYRELCRLGYVEDPNHAYYNTPAKQLELAEEDYLCRSFLCSVYKKAIDQLKAGLLNPNSFVLYSIEVSKGTDTNFCVKMDYGATNAFGGMLRKNEVTFFFYSDYPVLSQIENVNLYKALGGYSNVMDFLAGWGDHYVDDAAVQALMNGTATYQAY